MLMGLVGGIRSSNLISVGTFSSIFLKLHCSIAYFASNLTQIGYICRFSTTRREVLKLGSLAIGLGSAYFSATHLKVWCFRSCLGRIREFRS